MPIQQIGGRNVYIITGTNTDPSKTSTGQSWANLVTQQKYQIFKDVQEEALRQFQQQATDYQSQVEFAEAQREKLRKEIAATRKAIQSVKDKERAENARRERDIVTEQNRRGRGESIRITTPTGSTSSGGGDFYGRQEALGLYDRQIRQAQDQASSLLSTAGKLGETYDEDALLPDSIKSDPKLQTMETYGEYIDYLNQEGVRQQNLAQQLTTKRDNVSDKQDAAFQQQVVADFGPKRGGRGGSVSRTVTQGEQPIKVAEPVTYDVTPDEEKLKKLEAELLGIQDPTAPTDSVIDLRRQIYQDKYIGQPQDEFTDKDYDAIQFKPSTYELVDDEEAARSMAEYKKILQQKNLQPDIEDLIDSTSIKTPITTQTTDDEVVSQSVFEDVQIGEPVPNAPQSLVQDTPQSLVQDLIDRGDAAIPTVFQEDETIDPADVALGEGRVSVPEAAPAPMPMTAAPSDFASRFSRIGRQMNLRDLLSIESTTPTTPTLSDRFADVSNLSNDEKRIRAMELLEESKAQYGVTSKEFQKAKAKILAELQKQIDPTKARNLKKVRKNQEEAPANYYNLGTMVNGVKDETRRLVSSLFPVTDDTRVDEIESLYKNAQQQIRLAVKNKSQKRKALELLDLQYLAVLEDKR